MADTFSEVVVSKKLPDDWSPYGNDLDDLIGLTEEEAVAKLRPVFTHITSSLPIDKKQLYVRLDVVNGKVTKIWIG